MLALDRLWLYPRRRRDAAHQLVERLEGQGPAPLFLRCDLLDIAALREAIADVDLEPKTELPPGNHPAAETKHFPDSCQGR